MQTTQTLTHLAELSANPLAPVYLTETEAAAEAVASIGLLATTAADPAMPPSDVDWSPLSGRDVVILPRNYGSEVDFASIVATTLINMEIPPTVRILRLPDLCHAGDIVNWMDAREGEETQTIREEIESLVASTAAVELPLQSGPIVTCMADVERTQVSWLWPGRIPLGRVTLLSGRPGDGKSFLTTYIAACLTTGTSWPDADNAHIGSTLFITAEDDPGDTLGPRLDVHGADSRKVHCLAMIRRFDEDGKPFETMFSLANIIELEAAIKKLPDCKLIIIDPIGSYMGGKADSHRDTEVRAILAPIAALAAKYACAALIVAHHRKSGSNFGDDMVMGSRAFTGIARSSLHLVRDPENKDRRLLLPGKNNLAIESKGLAFTITGEPAALCWEREPLDLNADDLMSRLYGDGGKGADKLQEEQDWLREVLADGMMQAGEVLKQAKQAGFKEKPLRKALQLIGGKTIKSSFGGGWQWHLPTQAEPSVAKMAEDAQVVTFAEFDIFDQVGESADDSTAPDRAN